MRPGGYDLTIYAGSDLDLVFTWRDQSNALVNLTGWTAELQVRQDPSSPATLVDLRSNSGGILLGGAAGTIRPVLPAASSSALRWTNPAVWALELTSPTGVVTRLLEGKARLSPEVVQ